MSAWLKSVRGALLASMFVALCLAPASARAQAPAREPAFVYAVNAYTPDGYSANMYLPQHDTLYFLADQPNALAPRNTLIYYWAPSDEYRADWAERNELVNATLEVIGGGATRTFALTDYVVQYDSNNPFATLRVYTGGEANQQYQAFVDQRDAYWKALAAYQDAFRDYSEKLAEAARNSEGGTKPQPVPEKPQPVADFTRQSSTPVRSFVFSLPAGEYRIRLLDPRGAWLPGLDRKLIVFGARRKAISYNVLPQSKWTIAEQTDDPAQVIYVPGSGTFYLEPFLSAEYNALYYNRLRNPQSTTGSPNEWAWVRLAPLDVKALEVSGAGGSVRMVAFQGYRVSQLPGTAQGYEVLDYDPKTMRGSPSFEGFKVQVGASEPSLSIALRDVDGKPVAGSQRQVRSLQAPSDAILFILPFAALAIGALVNMTRRRRFAKLPRDAESQ